MSIGSLAKITGAILLLLFVAHLLSSSGSVLASPPSGGQITSWGLIESPQEPENVLVLYDSSTGDVWGYPEKGGLSRKPVYLGKMVKLGQPLAK